MPQGEGILSSVGDTLLLYIEYKISSADEKVRGQPQPAIDGCSNTYVCDQKVGGAPVEASKGVLNGERRITRYMKHR